ncbi:MAG: DUF721 domain-containing protein [Azospirillum sp.]|nr:DUF721 domain-containing protein [Azospirillum sp.]
MAGPRPLGTVIPGVAGAALGKRSLAFGNLVTDWTAIVGQRLADRTLPEKLAFPRGKREDAVLHLRVSGALALEVQHAAPQILERINQFFGYRAVARLKLVNAPPKVTTKRLVVPPPSAADQRAVAAAVGAVETPELRDALTRFGLALKARAGRVG